MSELSALAKEIKKWVVNDYFTPNIKAEVILDTLLTPYIPQILNSYGIDAAFLTKEMSLRGVQDDEGQESNRGSKIDYVLADKQKNIIYLMELKTTDSSMNAEQLSLYASLVNEPTTFGAVLGKRLLNILMESFQLDDLEGAGDDRLKDAWKKIWNKRKNYDPKEKNPAESGSYEERAMDLIKTKGWAWRSGQRSRKYLYTLGQLMDYLHNNSGKGLWNREVKLIYLLPRPPKDRVPFGDNILPVAFVPYFEENKDAPLADIIGKIYGGENVWQA